MKLVFLMATAGILLAGDPAPVTYVDASKVAVALEKGGALAKGDDFTVSGARRTGPGHVEVHEKETDIFYIVDGEATFVTIPAGAAHWFREVPKSINYYMVKVVKP